MRLRLGARFGAYVRMEDPTVTGASDVGIRSHYLASVRATRSSGTSNNTSVVSNWNAFVLNNGGAAQWTSATGHGACVQWGGVAHLQNGSSTGALDGLHLNDAAIVYANGASFTGADYGVEIEDTGCAQVSTSSVSGGTASYSHPRNDEDDIDGVMIRR